MMCPRCCCCCKRCVRRSQIGPLPRLLLRRRWSVGEREDGRVRVALRIAHGVVRGQQRLTRRLCCWRVGGCCVRGRHEGPRVLAGSSASAARSFACGGLLSSNGPTRLHELVVSMCVCMCVYIYTHTPARTGGDTPAPCAGTLTSRRATNADSCICLWGLFKVQGLGFRFLSLGMRWY